MEVSIALGILIANLTSPPFDGLLITFSESPSFHSLRDLPNLREKIESIRGMDWDMTTDLQTVFKAV